MRKTIPACLITALVCTIALSGCGPKATSEELVQSTMRSVDELMSSGMTNEAATVLSDALDNSHIDDKGLAAIFGALIQIKLMSQQDEDARALYMDAINAGDNSKVIAAYGRIMSYYRYSNNSEGLLEWTKILMNSSMPKDLSIRSASTHATTLYSTGQLDRLLALIPDLTGKYQTDTRHVLMPLMRTCLNKKDIAGANAILNALEKNVGSDTSLKSMVNSLRCSHFASQDKFNEASALFQKTVAQMSEQDASYALSAISQASINKPKHAPATDKLCQFILSSQKDKPKLGQDAARLWIESARSIGNLDVIPERLNALIEFNISSACIFSSFQQSFYAVLQSPNKKIQLAMLSLCDRLGTLLKDHPHGARCKGLKLDGAFMVEDFDLALEIIDSGVPDKDPDWLHMASTKLKAHKALKEGRNKDAIAHFREFMKIIKEDDKEESDPSTGLLHTTDMTLGFNERRIAEILLSDGDIKGAQECCDAAKAHYEKAMSDMEGKTREVTFIEKCLGDIKKLQAKIKAQSAAKTTAP